MSRKIILVLSLIIPSIFVTSGLAVGQIFFRDDFEQDEVGKEPSKWINFEGVEGEGKVVVDPTDPNNKVFKTTDRFARGADQYLVDIGQDIKNFEAQWDWYFWDISGEATDNCVGVVFRWKDMDNYFLLDKRNGNATYQQYTHTDQGWVAGPSWDVATEYDTWYRVHLKVEGNEFCFKVKKRESEEELEAMEFLEPAECAAIDKGYAFGPYGVSYIDNLVIGAVGADLQAVEAAGKLTATWASLKKYY